MTLANITVPTVNVVSWIVIGVLVLIALVVLMVVKKIIGKIISVVLVLGLAVAIYIQRDNLSNCAKDCQCTFFGIHVQIPDQTISEACKNAVNGG